jgi:hypothetical protein
MASVDESASLGTKNDWFEPVDDVTPRIIIDKRREGHMTDKKCQFINKKICMEIVQEQEENDILP